jgi:hypothetical protein
MSDPVDLKAIKASARREFGGVDGVNGFGLGERSVRVYVRDASVGDHLPHEYQGVPVEVVVTGDLVAQSTR